MPMIQSCEVWKFSPDCTSSFTRTKRNGKSSPWRSFPSLCWSFFKCFWERRCLGSRVKTPLILGIQEKPRAPARGLGLVPYSMRQSQGCCQLLGLGSSWSKEGAVFQGKHLESPVSWPGQGTSIDWIMWLLCSSPCHISPYHVEQS